MLSRQERQAIQEELGHYEHKRAACIEALKIVQRLRGWVSDEALRDLAPVLDMSVDELDDVATFYNLIFRKPVGRHVILVCDSISCWVMGYPKLLDGLSERLGINLGETTPEGRFTLLPNVCMGDCDHAPVIMIDDDTYGSVDVAKLDGILAKYT